MMDDLISRQAAIDAIEEYADRLQMVNWKENPNVPYKVYALNWGINTIRDLPSIDAVEVVRCKDCNHRYHSVECPCQSYDHFYSWMPADDWFCKKGERKEE